MTPDFDSILEKHNWTFYSEDEIGERYYTKNDLLELIEEVWNLALDAAVINAEAYKEGAFGHYYNRIDIKVDASSILKLKIQS